MKHQSDRYHCKTNMGQAEEKIAKRVGKVCKRARRTSATLYGSARCQWNTSQGNIRAIEIEPPVGTKNLHVSNSRNELEKKANTKTSEIECPVETKKYFFQTSASKTLWCFTGYYFSDHKSRRCSENTSFQFFHEKPCTGRASPIEMWENVTFEQN